MTTDRVLLETGRPHWHDAGADDLKDRRTVAWDEMAARMNHERMVASMKGDFAIAWRTSDGQSIAAIDRFGSRTLCYRVQDGRFDVASRADALAPTGAELDPQALFDYLYFHVIPSPRTIYRDVRRLPPGHFAVFANGQVAIKPYFVPTFEESSASSLLDLTKEFRRLLKQAVDRQLDGSRPACFLSGGTDSSTVAGMIGEVTGKPAATYSIGFEAAGYDEMAYARLAAKHFGTEHHEYYVTPADLTRSIAEVAGFYDQPFGNSSALPAYYCALQARKDGVTRLLGGDGGDELFGGNSRYATQEIFDWYRHVPRPLRHTVLEPFFGIGLVGRTPVLRKGSGYIRQANTPLPERLQSFNLLRRLGISNVLTPSFLAHVDPRDVSRRQQHVWDATRCREPIDRHLAYDWRYTLAENDLPKVRVTAAMAGIDVGFPMLDDDLVEFSTHLPANYKVNRLRLRWFFKRALRGFLPDEIISKRKQGFGLPFGHWTVQHEGLRRMAADSLNSFATRGVVRPEFIADLLAVRLPSHPHYYGTMVWILMVLEQWLRRHAPDYRFRD